MELYSVYTFLICGVGQLLSRTVHGPMLTPMVPVIASLDTLSCDFETSICGYTQDFTHGVDDEFDWTRYKGETPSSTTGPHHDHTYKNSTGHYVYIEASSPVKPGDRARLQSPEYRTLPTPQCLTFWYHMYGQHIGDLNVYYKTTNNASLHGPQNDTWHIHEVLLPPSTNLQVIFEGVRGMGFRGDIALDDIHLINTACPSLTVTTQPELTTNSMEHATTTTRRTNINPSTDATSAAAANITSHSVKHVNDTTTSPWTLYTPSTTTTIHSSPLTVAANVTDSTSYFNNTLRTSTTSSTQSIDTSTPSITVKNTVATSTLHNDTTGSLSMSTSYNSAHNTLPTSGTPQSTSSVGTSATTNSFSHTTIRPIASTSPILTSMPSTMNSNRMTTMSNHISTITNSANVTTQHTHIVTPSSADSDTASSVTSSITSSAPSVTSATLNNTTVAAASVSMTHPTSDTTVASTHITGLPSTGRSRYTSSVTSSAPSVTSATLNNTTVAAASVSTTDPTSDTTVASTHTTGLPSTGRSMYTSSVTSSAPSVTSATLINTTVAAASVSTTDPTSDTNFASTQTTGLHTTGRSEVTTVSRTRPSTSDTTRATRPHWRYTEPPVSRVCASCSGAPEICEAVYENVTCHPPRHYCINHVVNTDTGFRTVQRGCGDFDTCYNRWYLDSSDEDKCRRFDESSVVTVQFDCTYCCVEDACNIPLHPPMATLYRDKNN